MRHKLLVSGLVLALILVLMGGAVGQAQPVAASGNNSPVYNGGLVNQSFYSADTFSYQFGDTCFTDPEGDSLSYTAALTNGSPLPAGLSFNGYKRTFSGTMRATGVPNVIFNIRVTATDSFSAAATGDFTLEVRNSPPIFKRPDKKFAKVNVPFIFTASSMFTDPDGDSLTYTSSIPPTMAWLTFNASTGTYTGNPQSPPPGYGSEMTIYIDAIDNMSYPYPYTDGDWQLQVVNDFPPVYVGGLPDRLVWVVGSARSYQFGPSVFVDPEGEPVTYQATNAAGVLLPRPIGKLTWLNFDSATRTLYGTPEPSQVYDTTIYIRATDPLGNRGHKGIGLKVVPADDGTPPVTTASFTPAAQGS